MNKGSRSASPRIRESFGRSRVRSLSVRRALPWTPRKPRSSARAPLPSMLDVQHDIFGPVNLVDEHIALHSHGQVFTSSGGALHTKDKLPSCRDGSSASHFVIGACRASAGPHEAGCQGRQPRGARWCCAPALTARRGPARFPASTKGNPAPPCGAQPTYRCQARACGRTPTRCRRLV